MKECTYQKKTTIGLYFELLHESLRPFGFEEFRMSCSLCFNETNYQIKLIYDLLQAHNLFSGGFTTLELITKQS